VFYIETIVFHIVSDQVSLWEAVLPPELLKLPDELTRVDALLDDPVFFAPFVPFFDPRIGRPSTLRSGCSQACSDVSSPVTLEVPRPGSVLYP